MSDLIDAIKRLESALARPTIPIGVDLWSVREIAAYLKRSEQNTRERITSLPTFPPPIQLPTPRGTSGQKLWKAVQVISWAEKHQERRAVSGR